MRALVKSIQTILNFPSVVVPMLPPCHPDFSRVMSSFIKELPGLSVTDREVRMRTLLHMVNELDATEAQRRQMSRTWLFVQGVCQEAKVSAS